MASVTQAFQDGHHPERLSLLIPPTPYDPVAYARNPQAYLHVVEPGRVYQTADPTTGAAALEAIGGGATRVIPRQGRVELAVRTAPGAPCTFLAIEGGSFAENRLSCATVVAAADGIARATFQADDGTVDDATILAGSPAAVGTLALIVHIHHTDSFMPAPAGDTHQP